MSINYTRKKIQNYSYGLTDVIGKGYSSQVYKGKNQDNDEPVAIKVIDMRMLKNEINKLLLDSQILILKELKEQPHILNLFDVYTTKNNTYIITELCQSDLSKLIKNGLAETEACRYMQQIISGYLNFATKQIIHRDLKPANILITKAQQLKIADFGFAIKSSDAHKYSKYNVGSPLYMAPESLKKNEYTLKTDIWALGIIFFELLTGQTPWKAKNEKELLKKIESQKIDELLYKVKSTNPLVKQFLKKTLQMDKSARIDLQYLKSFTFQTPFASFRPNILMQKKMNSSVKNMSIDQRNVSMFSPKTNINEKRFTVDSTANQNRLNIKDFSERKINTFRNQSINKSVQMKPALSHKFSPSINLDQHKRTDSSCHKENPEFSVPQPRLTNQIEKKCDKKFTSKLLISEIHFCRFLYKLLTKISQSSKKGLLQYGSSQVQSITKDYMGIIKHKIQNLLSFKTINYIKVQNYQEYKQTNDYIKLMKIGKEYRDRYSSEMKVYWNNCSCKFSTDSTLSLISLIHKMLLKVEREGNFTQEFQKEIIILDYLMTSKQLIDIFKTGQNYERFAKKSRIQQIVQGKTSEITLQLYYKIITRSSEMLNLNKIDRNLLQPMRRDRERQRSIIV